MKFQFPEDFVPSEEQLELQFSVNEWKIIQKALIQFALQDLSITPAVSYTHLTLPTILLV